MVCTECGVVVEKHEHHRKPFRLPMQMNLHMDADAQNVSMLQDGPSASPAARRSPILEAATTGRSSAR